MAYSSAKQAVDALQFCSCDQHDATLQKRAVELMIKAWYPAARCKQGYFEKLPRQLSAASPIESCLHIGLAQSIKSHAVLLDRLEPGAEQHIDHSSGLL